MLAHRPSVALAQAIVEPLVVGVIKALVLHRPFQIPIDLGHEAEAGNLLANPARRLRPEERRPRPQVRSNTSGRTSIAMSQRTPSHWPAIFISSPIIASCVAGLAVVELQCVGPAGKVRIATVSQQQSPCLRLTQV